MSVSCPNRGRPHETVEFAPPLVGPSGHALVRYRWVWRPIEYVDFRGEDRVARVSDWDEAVPSADTGREIVHQFDVRCPLGHVETVSRESAIAALGFGKRLPEGAKSAITAAQTLVRLRMEYLACAALVEACERADESVRAIPRPTLPEGADADGWARLPCDPEIRVRVSPYRGFDDERKGCLIESWRRRVMLAERRAAGIEATCETRDLVSRVRDAASRVSKAEARLAVALASAAPKRTDPESPSTPQRRLSAIGAMQ